MQDRLINLREDLIRYATGEHELVESASTSLLSAIASSSTSGCPHESVKKIVALILPVIDLSTNFDCFTRLFDIVIVESRTQGCVELVQFFLHSLLISCLEGAQENRVLWALRVLQGLNMISDYFEHEGANRASAAYICRLAKQQISLIDELSSRLLAIRSCNRLLRTLNPNEHLISECHCPQSAPSPMLGKCTVLRFDDCMDTLHALAGDTTVLAGIVSDADNADEATKQTAKSEMLDILNAASTVCNDSTHIVRDNGKLLDLAIAPFITRLDLLRLECPQVHE